MNVKIYLSSLLLIFSKTIWIAESDECGFKYKSNSKYESQYVENIHVLSNLTNGSQKNLSLVTGIPYFLLNNNHVNQTFYGVMDRGLRNRTFSGKVDQKLWVTNADVGNKHMQWDIVPTKFVGFYQIRRGLDGLVLTCIRNSTWVGLGNETQSREMSWWTIEEYQLKRGYFTIRCKQTPDRLLTDDQTNELITNIDVYDDRFLWQFLPGYRLEDYYLKIKINKFDYMIELEDLFQSDRQTIAIAEKILIPNPSSATLQHQFTQSKTIEETVSTSISQSFTQGSSSSSHTSSSIQHSQSTKYGVTTANSNTYDANFEYHADLEVSAEPFGMGTKATAGFKLGFDYKHEDSETHSEEDETGVVDDETWGSESGNTVENTTATGTQHEHTESVTYTIQQTIEVPPNSSVEIEAYIDWLSDLTVPFTATAFVTLDAVRTLKSFNACIKNSQGARRCRYNARTTRLDADAVEWFLRQYNADLATRIVDRCGQAVILDLDGYVTGSYGLKSVFIAKNVPLDMMLVSRIDNN